MTGLVFGAILLVTVACWLELRDEGIRPYAISFLAAAPFLLFSTIAILTFATAPAGEYRVALEGVEVDLAADGQAVTVGGGETDDVIVSDLPPRYLTFRVEGEQVVAALPAELEQALENPAHAAVRVGNAKPFANSVALPAPIVIEGFGTASPVIPPRRQEITEQWSIPIWRNLTADTAMYPLRFFARRNAADDVVTGRDNAPLGSFLSHEGGFFRRTLYVTLTGDGTRAGNVRYNPRVAVIQQGKPVGFALYRLDYNDPQADRNRRSRAQERRSFRASYDKGRLAIVFDTPDYVRLAPKALAPLVKDGQFLLATRDPRRDAPVIANQMVLSFPQLGPRVQNELFSVIRVAESGDCRMRVTAHTGTGCYGSGEAFRVGERAAAILRVTEMGTPWGIIATLLVLALLSFLWMWRTGNSDRLAVGGWRLAGETSQNVVVGGGLPPTANRQPPTDQERLSSVAAIVIVSAAEVLLAVRLLIAFEGALLDPASAAGVWESLVAFALLPFTLRIARDLRTLRSDWRTQAVECAAVAAVVAVVLVRANISAAWIAAVCAAVVLVPLAAGWLAHAAVDRVSALRWSWRVLLGLAVAVASIRVAMQIGLGWKERISLPGVDLALTIFYLPVVFVFFAMLWQKYRDFALGDGVLTAKRIGAALALVAAGALLTILIPWFVKDSGSALVHVPAIVLLFALPLFARADRAALALAAPLVLVLALHLAVGFLPHLRGQEKIDPAYQKALTDEREAHDFMARRLGQSTNQLRVLSQVAPHQLEEAGTSRAEGLVMQRRVLDRYGGTGLFGAGYLNVPLTTFLDTHMNDNLSAIHILAPFGIAGALGVLSLLLALALLPLLAHFDGALDERPEQAVDQRGALGILALWTFSLCGIYMIAANLGLVLFTGKNVYLLAATSNSDAIEGGVLLLIALVAFSRHAAPPANEATT